ncbi:DedA family protein [Amaricoccus macauensis]|uniref:DedA family protein n=1 Tax=Amaricoccus macauensis TaxID=57001 RepID=UPI003C7D395A
MTVDHLISDYGLWAIFLGCFLEGETVAITGGVFAHRGLLVLWKVAVTAACAAVSSDLLFFLLGRYFKGNSWVRRIMALPKFAAVMVRIDKRPGRFASVFRFIPGMRIIGPLALAQSRISSAEFAVRAGVSAGIWAVFFTTAGHFVGRFITLIFGQVDRTELLFFVPVSIGVILIAIVIWRRKGSGARRG